MISLPSSRLTDLALEAVDNKALVVLRTVFDLMSLSGDDDQSLIDKT